MTNYKLVNWLIFILLSVIWGSSFILMKKSAEHLSGIQIGAIRILAAGVVLLPFGIYSLGKIPKDKLLIVLLTGILGTFFPAFMFAIAIEKDVDSSLAGILNSLTPLFVVLIGFLFFRSQVSRRKLVGVLIGFIGLVLLSFSRGSISMSDFGYSMLILLATLLYGFNVNLVSHKLKEVPPMQMASVSLGFIGIWAFFICWQQHVFSIWQYDEEARWPILASALLGIVATAIATAVFYVLIKRAGGLFASLVTYGIPVISILWGLWDHEQVTLLQLGCLGMILGGVYVANK
ncbi:MAG: DMT family transporter [Flavisolibacter sp.]|jgi:drug/metabolite transporter (DMT)-like permease|nr:DMT family transporter [Flavisolibacter sp.]